MAHLPTTDTPASRVAEPAPNGARPTASEATASGGRAARHIPEIDGLRGVAVALVVVYHVWLNRVSGGVDVFLMLSGMLVTLSLVRSVERNGRVDILGFYARIVRRIFPPALAVLAGVVVATVLWLPRVRWQETLGDVVAAAFYYVNWHLAANAVDYLAAQNAASPVQHYWSLAIQGQFYLTWPLLIAVVALLATRLGRGPRGVLAAVLATLLAASLLHSVLATATDQAHAYFSTFTRVWELALGALVGLALPYLRLPGAAKVVLGWVGLVALVTCGLVFRSGDEFPGYAALWPTLAAALLVATAGSGSTLGADRLLRGAALRRLGDLSYALYLWHWPVLICYLAVTDRTAPSLTGGLLVIAVSLALAAATHWLLERRLPATGLGQRTRRGGVALGAAFLVLVLLCVGGWAGMMRLEQQREARLVAEAGPEAYPGAVVLTDGVAAAAGLPYRPSALEAKDDLPVVYDTGCHQDQEDPEAIACAFGARPDEASATVALVGGSHSAHWLPTLRELAETHDLRVVSMTKSACLFSTDAQVLEGEPYVACHEWNDNVLAELDQLRPDVVFTTATRIGHGREETPDGYVEQWRALEGMELDVVAIRDTPWPLVDVPECVETHGPTATECGRDRDEMYPPGPPEVTGRADLPGNVRFLDLTDAVCAESHCPAVVGNVLVYRDNSHLTSTYARTLAPALAEALFPLPPREQ